MRKRVATKEFVRRLRGSVSQNLISDLVWTSFAPRSDLVKIAASQNPARRGFGKALQWSAAWSAAAAVVVACVAASGQGAVFWAEKQEICERAGSFCLPQNQSTLTVGVPIGFPPGERLVMSGVSGVPCGWRKF